MQQSPRTAAHSTLHTSQAPATAVLSLSCACATHNSHLRRRIVAAVNAAVAAGEVTDAGSRTSTCQAAGTTKKRRKPRKEGLQRRLNTRRWHGAKPSQGARARYVASRVPAPPPRSIPHKSAFDSVES